MRELWRRTATVLLWLLLATLAGAAVGYAVGWRLRETLIRDGRG